MRPWFPSLLLLCACTGRGGSVPDVALGHPRAVDVHAAVTAPWAARSPGAALAFGRDPHEPLGPNAVFTDGAGVAVLDQEQRRIVRFDADGNPLGTVPIPSPTTLDAVATPDGYGLLAWSPGADAHWSVQTIGADGALHVEQRVTPDPPTAVLVDRAGGGARLLVEDAHADTLDPLTGQRFPGRPSGTGWYVQAQKDDLHHVTLTWSDADGSDTRAVRLVVDRPVVNVLALDPDADTATVGLFLMENTTDPAAARPEIRVLRVDRFGHLAAELSLPAGAGIDAQRGLAALPDGRVVQLRADTDGVALDVVQP